METELPGREKKYASLSASKDEMMLAILEGKQPEVGKSISSWC